MKPEKTQAPIVGARGINVKCKLTSRGTIKLSVALWINKQILRRYLFTKCWKKHTNFNTHLIASSYANPAKLDEMVRKKKINIKEYIYKHQVQWFPQLGSAEHREQRDSTIFGSKYTIS